jgi:hypothetical protein
MCCDHCSAASLLSMTQSSFDFLVMTFDCIITTFDYIITSYNNLSQLAAAVPFALHLVTTYSHDSSCIVFVLLTVLTVLAEVTVVTVLAVSAHYPHCSHLATTSWRSKVQRP